MPARSSPSPTPSASPRTAAARPGRSCLANGRGAQVDPASPLAREPYLAVAELTGSAAAGRILLAAPITLEEIAARFADRIVAREELSFDPASAQPAAAPAAAVRGAHARRPAAGGAAERGDRAGAGGRNFALGVDRLPWTNALRQWRDRVMFLRRAEGRAPAILARSVRCRARRGRRLADARIGGQDRAGAAVRRRICRRAQEPAALPAAAPARGRGADPFRRAVRLARADRLRGRRRAEARHPRPGTVRPRPPSGYRRRQDPAAGRTVVAGAPAGPAHPRPARLLARQLRRRARRDARALSAAPVAG